MHLLDLFESTVEGYTVTRGIDRDRYSERAGLEGPFQTKSGKVVYYDKKEGQYYDPDTDMYIDHDDYRELDESDEAKFYIWHKKSQELQKMKKDASAKLQKFPKGEMGLVPDSIRKTPEYKKAKSDYDKIAQAERKHNTGVPKKWLKMASDIRRKGMMKEEDELDEGVGTYLKGAVLAGLLGLGVNQMADMASAKNSPLGQAMAQAAEQGDEYAAKHLNKLDLYMDSNDTGSIKILSKKYLGRTVESVMENEVATNKRTERILGLLRAKNPTAQNDLEALILSFEKGQRQDREDINTLYTQNSEEDREIEELEKELERIKNKRKVSEDYYETDEQRELARMGRILMDMGKKRDDNVGKAMGRVGNELTKYGTPQGASNIKKLEKVTGQPESVIMKMMALAQKVKGDVAVGDETAGNNDEEEEVKTEAYKDPRTREKERIGRASDEFDVTPDNWEVKIDGKPWKVFRTKQSANKAASTIEMRYGKKTTVFATRKPVSEGAAKDFDDKFSKYSSMDESLMTDKEREEYESLEYRIMQMEKQIQHAKNGTHSVLGPEDVPALEKQLAQIKKDGKGIGPVRRVDGPSITHSKSSGLADSKFDDNFSKYIGYTLGGGEPAKMLQKQGDQRQADNPDAGTGLGPSVLNIPKARKKAAEKGVKAPGNLRASPNTRDPKRLPEQAESPMVSASIPNNTSDTAARLQRLAKENGVEYARQGRTVTLTGPRMNVRNIFFKMAYTPGNHPEMVPVTEGLDHDIRIGDTVETKKMGQMQGVVTGFSTKTGDTRVMFKHKSGKVYATVPDNLRVISSKKTEGLDDTVVEAKKKPVPTKPDKWAYAKSQAKEKFDVYPSAYANAWAAKKYKELGGGWRMGTKEDIEEMEQLEELKCWPGYERVPGTTAGEVGSCRKKGKKK